jgi:nitrogenase molybdenum-cofactor synthesis protein NifE
VLLITGGVKSWSVVAALQEVGIEIVGTSVKKSTKEDKERIKEIMGEEAHMIDDMPPREMYKMLKEARADIMLSGGRSQFIALKAKMPWLDINQERHHAFAGYEGMVKLVQEIDKTLYNPVWEQVRLPAPWDVAGDLPSASVRLPNRPAAQGRTREGRGENALDSSLSSAG